MVLERMNTGLARDGRRIVGEPDGYYLLVEVPVEEVAAKERGFVSNALRWLGSLDAEAALVVLPQLLVDEETVANYQRKLFWGLADTADERAAGPLARALNRLEGVGHCYTVSNYINTWYSVAPDPYRLKLYTWTLTTIAEEETDPETRLIALMALAVQETNGIDGGTDDWIIEALNEYSGIYPVDFITEVGVGLFMRFIERVPEVGLSITARTLVVAEYQERVLDLLLYVKRRSYGRRLFQGTPDLLAVLGGIASSSIPESRSEAMDVLGAVYGDGAAPYITAGMLEPSAGVRWDAADLYAEYELAAVDWETAASLLPDNRWSGHYEFLLELCGKEPEPLVYEVLIVALASTRDPRAVEVLADIFAAAPPSDTHTRLGMLKCLRMMETPEADAAARSLISTSREREFCYSDSMSRW